MLSVHGVSGMMGNYNTSRYRHSALIYLDEKVAGAVDWRRVLTSSDSRQLRCTLKMDDCEVWRFVLVL